MLAALRTAADRLLAAGAVVLMLAMLAVVVLGVAFRVAGNPITWADELAQYLLVWLGFVGWIIASRRRSHIRITVIADRIPGALRRVLEIATQAAILTFAGVLLWQAGPLIRRNIDVETVTLPFPSAAIYVLLPVLAVALTLQAVAAIVETVRGEAGPATDPAGGALT